MTDTTQTADSADASGQRLLSARWPGLLVLLVSLPLVSAAWPKLHASLRYLPVSSALDRYFDTRDIPSAQLQALADRAAEVVRDRPHHRYWYGLAQLRYLQALDPATPRWQRTPSLRRSLSASIESLRRSPVNPYAWLQVAQVRSTLELPADAVVTALEMSWLTGRVEPYLLLPRLELGAAHLAAMDAAQRAQLSDQAGLALRLRQDDVLRSLRAGRLDMTTLRRLTPPGLKLELETLEKRLGPAS